MQSLKSSIERSRVVILGNDALVAARPATPIQLARACMAAGFAFVAPSSWGDELIAQHAGEHMAANPPGASLLLHCPYVLSSAAADQTRAVGRCLSVSPPIAAARYVRAGFAPHDIAVTYVGACPGGQSPEIDEHVSPEAFVTRLHKAGLSPLLEPDHFDDILPADRSRFASRPGGAPNSDWLFAHARAILRDVAPETVFTVARAVGAGERYLLDLAEAAGCRCSHDAVTVQRMEPARASSPVISTELPVDLSPTTLGHSADGPGMTGERGSFTAEPPGESARTLEDAAAYWVFDDPEPRPSSGTTSPVEPHAGVPSAWWPSSALSSGPAPSNAGPPNPAGHSPYPDEGPRLTILPAARSDLPAGARDVKSRTPRLPPARTRPRADAANATGSLGAESKASGAPKPFMRRPVDVRTAASPEPQTSTRLGQRLPGRSRSSLLTQLPPVTTSDSPTSTPEERQP